MNARDIVEAALTLDAGDRAAYVAQQCHGDPALLQEVEAQLAVSSAATATFGGGVAEDPSATQIGPYRLIRQLGEGGMGIVYHAHQTHPLRRDVALKVIKPGMDSRQVIARFESERQALALMDHPNIARVFDAGTTPQGRPYFAMEMVDGVPITGYCNEKRMTVRERIALFIPVCQAIQHAHQKGIIHRDIKPSNVLVADREGRPVPKVIDFGLAKALGHRLSDTSMMTNVGVVVGTLEYMSPEQAELTRQDIDTRSDVYSLGAVLYELLTGATPLAHGRGDAMAYIDALKRIREEEPVRPSARVRGLAAATTIAAERRSDSSRLLKVLSGELTWIVMKTLEKDRARRYETVNALARDLERYLAGDPVEAGPPSRTYRLRKFAGRHRVGLAMATTIAILLVGTVATSTWMAVRANRAEAEARAVSDFLRNDVLAQAGAGTQARADVTPDPDLKVRTALERAAARIGGKFAGQPLVEASIRQTIGDAFSDLGVYTSAEPQLQRALDLRRRVLGEDHRDTLQTLYELGDAYTEDGKFADAEALLERGIELARRQLGENDPTTLTIGNNLARTYRREGKYQQAELLYNAVLDGKRRVLGEENTETLTTENNLAILLHSQGRDAAAEPLMNEVVAVWRRDLGDDNPLTITAMNNLALVHFALGKYADAEATWDKVLGIVRRVLGKEHPNTLTSIANLAAVYRAEGRYADAEPLLTGALAVGTRVQGAQHPNTLLTMHKLADLYRDEGKYAEAESLYRSVVNGRRSALGEQHPDTLNSRVSWARVALLQKQYASAEVELRDVLAIYEKTAPDTWDRYDSEALLGASLAGQKKLVEAEPLLRAGYDGMVQHQASVAVPDRIDLAPTVGRIIACYDQLGDTARADEWRQKSKK